LIDLELAAGFLTYQFNDLSNIARFALTPYHIVAIDNSFPSCIDKSMDIAKAYRDSL
jgi:hypothetical protein